MTATARREPKGARGRAPRDEAGGHGGPPPEPPVRVQSFTRGCVRLFVKRYFGLRIEGRQHVPGAGPALIVPNHPTYADPFLVGFGTRRFVTWMAWQEAFQWPGVGTAIRALGAYPIDPERPRPSTIKGALELLRAGRLLGLFLEGARTAGQDLLDPPKRGAARIAVIAGVPVVPVSVVGARSLWPRERRLPRPGKVVVRFHPPIDPRATGGASAREREERLTEAIVAAIRSGLRPGP